MAKNRREMSKKMVKKCAKNRSKNGQKPAKIDEKPTKNGQKMDDSENSAKTDEKPPFFFFFFLVLQLKNSPKLPTFFDSKKVHFRLEKCIFRPPNRQKNTHFRLESAFFDLQTPKNPFWAQKTPFLG
jgi:hypothetical protein